MALFQTFLAFAGFVTLVFIAGGVVGLLVLGWRTLLG